MRSLVFIFLSLNVVNRVNSWDKTIEKLERQNVLLSRQIMMQQLFNEERIRSEGNSGVKTKRHRHEGTRSYYSDSYTGLQFLNIHDHANHRHTIGLGEFIAVLNGVEFRTRHNDYGLYKPSTTSKTYHEIEDIELPDVPPEVLSKRLVSDQIEEMRLWFKAFKDMDKSVRDYRKYFKPILCYLEGAWTLTDPENTIEEPFKSDRHKLSAIDWNELHRKIRYTSYTGGKSNGENLAFLPTTILDMVNDTEPVFAQWNYRILCHPLNRYLEVDRLRVVDDLAPRMAYTRTLLQHAQSRSARFQINSENGDAFEEGHTYYTLIDRLMSEIPGKDNYRRFLRDDSFGIPTLNYNNGNKPLNAARYHRWYQFAKTGANGRHHTHRSFADDTVFMARNTQPNIAAETVNDNCKRNDKNEKYCRNKYTQRWSYAIPLEIIYLTPLGKWNPYNIKFDENAVREKNRNGGKTQYTAFNGSSSKMFYRTPSDFFTGKRLSKDAADTSGRSVGVLNETGDVCSVMASGVYITLPEIDGVGSVRTRYPVAPVHQEGSAIWKEVQALRDLILLQDQKQKKLRDEFGLKTDLNSPSSGTEGHNIIFSMQYAPPLPEYHITAHTHTIIITPSNMAKLKAGRTIKVVSSIASGHSHELRVMYDSKSKTPYTYTICDGVKICFDKHGKELNIIRN